MRVLMIGSDYDVLNPATPAGKRMVEYRQVLGELEILVVGGNIFNFVVAFFRGVKLLRRHPVDIITAQSPEHWLLAYKLAWFFGIPWQAQVHTDIFNPYFTKSGKKPEDYFQWTRSDVNITDDDGKKLFVQRNVEFPEKWSPLARKIVASKYFFRTVSNCSFASSSFNTGKTSAINLEPSIFI